MDWDSSSFQTLGTSLKAALDIVKGIREAKSATETERKVIELQAALQPRLVRCDYMVAEPNGY